MPRGQLIKFRKGSAAPTAADFLEAEPAWDSIGKKLYIKAADGSMAQVGGGTSASLVRIDSTSTANIIYVGKAAAGSAESSAVWTITRIVLTTAGVQSAPSSSLSAVAWTNRASLTYP